MTDFIYDTGTNGFTTAPASLMTTELNSLASGGAATSSVNGTSGVFNQASFGSALWGSVYFSAGGAFTPTAGGHLAGWFLLSGDASNYETTLSTPSTTVAALSRNPDFYIPLDAVAHASGNLSWCNGRRVLLPAESYKVLIQNNSGAALPSSGNVIKCGAISVKF